MLQRDYIVRMIEQCAQALARLIAKKTGGQPEQALVELNDASRSLLGVEPASLMLLSAPDVVRLFTLSGRPDLPRISMALRILDEAADLARVRGDEATARRAGRLARELFIVGMPLLDAGWSALLRLHAESLRRLATAVESDEGAPPEAAMALCRYYETLGEYARAEDRLYALTVDGDAAGVAFGIAFYRRLLDRDDEELVRGNLPRDEVEEGLARLLG